MDPPPDTSPLLPWEVIERIISHSWDPDASSRSNSESIRNFSLTCRELRPRSLCFLVADAAFSSRDKIFDFCDFLQTNPHLKPFVRSISLLPTYFAPVPLLRILPNLSEIKFSNTRYSAPNQSILTCCRLLSTRIQTLSFSNLQFETAVQFFRLLSAFTNITHLACWNVQIIKEGDQAFVSKAKQRLSQRLRLLTLSISYDHWEDVRIYRNGASVGTLLLDSGLVQSTIESITVNVHRSSGLPQKFDWPRLWSLTLTLWSSESKEIASGIEILKDFHHPTLKEVTIELHEQNLASITGNIARHAELYEELERALLEFSRGRLVWIIDVRPINSNSFWIQGLGKRFPALSQRGAFMVAPNKDFHAGHTQPVRVLAVSPDSKCAASGSSNGTIVLWDTANGAIVQQFAPRDLSLGSSQWLAFSPNGQYLISAAGDDRNIVIWDLTGGEPRVFEGQTGCITSCAWSPMGDVIASGSEDATVRLWDANTFQPLHVLQHAADSAVVVVEFSADGCWLLTGCRPCAYYIWDVASGAGRQLRAPSTDPDESREIGIAAAFDPRSTRFAIASPGGMVEILDTQDVEGSCHVVLGASGSLGEETRDVAFSPDGNLVLTVPDGRVDMHAIRIWDTYTGIKLLLLERHEKDVRAACFSPCGKYVASASDDCTVKLWSTSDGSCIATLSEHKKEVWHVVFSPDGKSLVSGDFDGSVIIRQMCNVLAIDEQDRGST